jgi:hypothetical protein
MKRTLLGKTGVWAAALALCVGVTICEMPNIDRVWRYRVNLQTNPTGNIAAALPDRVIAMDPEAGDILKYCLRCSRGDSSPGDLATLAAKYPKNEFLLCQLARRQAKAPLAVAPAAVELADGLLAIDPENACYRYLRGWSILEGRGGPERIEAALSEFDAGHSLPQFHSAYSPYKQRVDRLCEAAVLGYYSRPFIQPFSSDLAAFISRTRPPNSGLDRESFDRLTASASVIANRMIENAYDLASLHDGCVLLRATQEARLKELDLTEVQAQQARLQLGRAVALESMGVRWPPSHLNWNLISLAANATWMPLCCITIAALLAVCLRRKTMPIGTSGKRRLFPRSPLIVGIFVLLLFTVILIAQECYPRSGLSDVLLFEAFIVWLLYLASFARIDSLGRDDSRPARLFACGLLCLNGVTFLLAGRQGIAPAGESPWTTWLLLLTFWVALCTLIAAIVRDIVPLPGQALRTAALFAVTGWAVTLMYFDTFGAHWRYVDYLYANPLAVNTPLPQATRETYERAILAGAPAPQVGDEPHALPGYIAYAAPRDMEAFLAKRQAEGKPVTKSQLNNILKQCGQDVRPIILNALQTRDAQNDPPPIPIRPGKRPTYAALRIASPPSPSEL